MSFDGERGRIFIFTPIGNLISQSHLYAYNTLHCSLLQDLVDSNEQAILGEYFRAGILIRLPAPYCTFQMRRRLLFASYACYPNLHRDLFPPRPRYGIFSLVRFSPLSCGAMKLANKPLTLSYLHVFSPHCLRPPHRHRRTAHHL